MTPHAVGGVILGLLLAVPPVAAALALFGIWWGAVVWMPLLAVPSLIIMLRGGYARELVTFVAAALGVYVIGFTLLMLSGPADWSAYPIGIIVAAAFAVLLSPVSLIFVRARSG